MKIVHIVSSISSINFGVWNAALFGSHYLKGEHDVDSELWVCSRTKNETLKPEIPFEFLDRKHARGKSLRNWVGKYDREATIFVTHGAWLTPTHIGYEAKRMGFKWIYVSHGMLEPWALNNQWLKKKLYFQLFEKRMAIKADVIRAVSRPEQSNLYHLFKRDAFLIPNGVQNIDYENIEKPQQPVIYLFLARLQYKKGVLPLVKAWDKIIKKNCRSVLMIVGPDEGELKKIGPFFSDSIKYLGPQFGENKIAILKKAHYYLLPSFSEGFPTSVVEAMSYGAIPIITDGCNFPEVFENNLGHRIEPTEKSIKNVLEFTMNEPFDSKLSKKNIEFINHNYSEKVVGQKFYTLYRELLKS